MGSVWRRVRWDVVGTLALVFTGGVVFWAGVCMGIYWLIWG